MSLNRREMMGAVAGLAGAAMLPDGGPPRTRWAAVPELFHGCKFSDISMASIGTRIGRDGSLYSLHTKYGGCVIVSKNDYLRWIRLASGRSTRNY